MFPLAVCLSKALLLGKTDEISQIGFANGVAPDNGMDRGNIFTEQIRRDSIRFFSHEQFSLGLGNLVIVAQRKPNIMKMPEFQRMNVEQLHRKRPLIFSDYLQILYKISEEESIPLLQKCEKIFLAFISALWRRGPVFRRRNTPAYCRWRWQHYCRSCGPWPR